MVICLQQDADLHTAQLMPLPLIVSCFSKIQIGFTFLVPAHLGSPGKRAVKWVCVCVCVPKSKKYLGTFKGLAWEYDTRCYFNVRSKADMNRLNLPHGDDN